MQSLININYKARVTFGNGIQIVSNTLPQKIYSLEKYPVKLIRNVTLRQGAQLLNIPKNSVITNITLDGGASYESNWANLRGAVLKFDKSRSDKPIEIDGNGTIISPVYSLMDEIYFEKQAKRFENEKNFRIIPLNITSSEPLYCVHSSWCHPNLPGQPPQLFIEQGLFTKTSFKIEVLNQVHMLFLKGILYLHEGYIDDYCINWIKENLTKISSIKVDLREGNLLELSRNSYEIV